MTTSNRRNRPYIAAERAAAIEAFRVRYGAGLRFAPVLVVIAAFDEEGSLGQVLGAIGSEACGVA